VTSVRTTYRINTASTGLAFATWVLQQGRVAHAAQVHPYSADSGTQLYRGLTGQENAGPSTGAGSGYGYLSGFDVSGLSAPTYEAPGTMGLVDLTGPVGPFIPAIPASGFICVSAFDASGLPASTFATPGPRGLIDLTGSGSGSGIGLAVSAAGNLPHSGGSYQTGQLTLQPAQWLATSLEEMSAAVAKARNSERGQVDQTSVAVIQELAQVCASFGLPEPTIELDEDGNIELFIRTLGHGILFIARRNGMLQLFGNSQGESWRARYEVSGQMWRQHLPAFLYPLAKERMSQV
jgi:hypothetical protein